MINLKKIYNDQHFKPSLLGIFVNPFFIARRNLYIAMIDFSKSLHGNLLDVGCGTKPYRSIFHVDSYRGLDIKSSIIRDQSVVDDFYDGNNFPYNSNTFDSALCNQVLEHVFNPDNFLSEICRVLKPGGKLLLTVPFVWDEHEQPNDFARYSSFGLRALLERNGFLLIRHEKLAADCTVIFQLINAYLFKIIVKWPRFFQIFFTATIMSIINVVGLILSKILPSNTDLFLDHIILAEKQS